MLLNHLLNINSLILFNVILPKLCIVECHKQHIILQQFRYDIEKYGIDVFSLPGDHLLFADLENHI